MFQNDYRREMDGLRPSPAAVERLNRLLEEGVPARRPRRLGRRAAVLICSALTLGVGLFIEGEAKVSSWMDFITIVVTPLGALLGAVSIYYVLGWPRLRAELQTGRDKLIHPAFGAVGKYIYVPLTLLVVILGFAYGGIG